MTHLLKLIALASIIAAPAAIRAQNCNLSEYKPSPGLSADAAQKTLTVTWEGEKNEEIRLRLTVTRRDGAREPALQTTDQHAVDDRDGPAARLDEGGVFGYVKCLGRLNGGVHRQQV